MGCESCAPHTHPHAAAASAVASGFSLHSDLRDNELKEFSITDFLARALQLQTLYAAANASALRARRTFGSMAHRRAGGNALYCRTNSFNCQLSETLRIRSRATEMYASVAASPAATHE
jgi:hypothetical protein